MTAKLRQLLAIDFTLGFLGGLGYYFLFDFITETIGIDPLLANAQMLANFSYAGYGLTIFILNKGRKAFRFLVTMNFAYAGACLGFAIFAGFRSVWPAAALLLTEGILVGGLAWIELRAFRFNIPNRRVETLDRR